MICFCSRGDPHGKIIDRNISAYQFYEVEQPAVPSKSSHIQTPPKRPHDYELDYAEDNGGIYKGGPGERRQYRHKMYHEEEVTMDEDGLYYPRDRIEHPAKRARLGLPGGGVQMEGNLVGISVPRRIGISNDGGDTEFEKDSE
ncbi:hypothetical protein ABKN59_006653 [Abortiporus biennis]